MVVVVVVRASEDGVRVRVGVNRHSIPIRCDIRASDVSGVSICAVLFLCVWLRPTGGRWRHRTEPQQTPTTARHRRSTMRYDRIQITIFRVVIRVCACPPPHSSDCRGVPSAAAFGSVLFCCLVCSSAFSLHCAALIVALMC